MITIQELLFNRGLDQKCNVKLVRHQDKRYPDLYDWYRFDKVKFLNYQSLQSRPVFDGVDFIVSFIGEGGGNLSRFVGVFKVKNLKHFSKPKSVQGFPSVSFKYELEEMNGFDDLKERVIVKWGNPISWHQWIKNEMEVVEIHPGLHYKKFNDYFDFILSFTELKEIVNKQYSDWKKMLSITKGVYLISDSKSGKLYVGSAYGDEGIWGRWANYIKTNGHGNNKALKSLISKNIDYAENFKFSILMLLPRTITADEAIKKEMLFKNKLGTNSHGLNNN
ncbi:MAG: GIY-YIG nuclease family protein [Bacteroidota bacterium]